MRLTDLKAANFRCFEHIRYCPADGVNVITGDNASGKTTVLEAIYLCGRGQTFRSNKPRNLIRQGTDALLVNGRVVGSDSLTRHIGVTCDASGLTYRVNRDPQTKRLDLVTTLPVQFISPNLHRLLERGPKFRRQFMDWGVFHVEHRFFPAWQRYRRALKQRNKALRSRASDNSIHIWDHEMIRSAQVVDDCRRAYVERLRSGMPDSIIRILGEQPPTLVYQSGWKSGRPYRDALAASLDSDKKAGFTQQGPHRADFKVAIAGMQAKERVSRGQQKALIMALLLTQARLLIDETQHRPLLLMDDLAAELGPMYQKALLEEVLRLRCQCFVTALSESELDWLPNPTELFHVEHGQLSRLA